MIAISDTVETFVIPSILESLGDTGRHLSSLYEVGNHTALISFCKAFSPLIRAGDDTFAEDYAAVSLLKKYPNLRGLNPTEVEDATLKKWLESEDACRTANHRFSFGDSSMPWGALEHARNFIHGLLGDFSWDEVLDSSNFGPGASQGLSRRHRHRYYKFGAQAPSVTGPCFPLVECLPRWSNLFADLGTLRGDKMNIVPGGKYMTVPKDAFIKRAIVVEPLWNMFFQKGIGSMLRRRLKQAGNCIKFQDVNRSLAREASITGRAATIDFSSASDRLPRELVRFLLPGTWFIAMDTVRSSHVLLPNGANHLLSKFSSMGNGFTFELETLIFWALARASVARSGSKSNVSACSVYGDDVIIPVDSSDSFMELGLDVGFMPNRSKSFTEGFFRESCGGHYLSGVDVTPIYLDEKVGQVQQLLVLANQITRLASRLGRGQYRYGPLREAWLQCHDLLPVAYRCPIPDGFGDGGLVSSFDEACPTPKRAGNFVEGWQFRHYQRSPRLGKRNGLPALLDCLWPGRDSQLWAPNEGRQYTVPTGLTPLRSCVSVAPSWPYIGPWIAGSEIVPSS